MGQSANTLRILAVADIWQGSDAYAYVRAFRRYGHSVTVLPPENFVPGGWTSTPLRALRRALEPALVREYKNSLIAEAKRLRPHLFFVFKGRYVSPEAIGAIRELDAVAINFYPDVSFMAHGKYIPRSLPLYDWVFTTKSFGMVDMARTLGVRNASILAHSYDPEAHRPVRLTADEVGRYGCDVSFIGTWSPKKQMFLERVACELPDIQVRVWGSQWENAKATLGSRIEGTHVLGTEYAKALVGSKINLGILSEARRGSSSGDLITSRTFHIPATGSFMLHERTDELLEHFDEDSECACFETPDELVQKIEMFLANRERREAIAAAGRRRCETSHYSIDDRASAVILKFTELHHGRSRKES